ncbi:DUF6660 family protein [Phnomibacter sp. MR]|jgi:hypothetical protein|uniref:DUF6660 family protein n=1 Tax=unclassified Phnomibacter TaxID=2836226 RepID=UPI003A80D667
MKFFAFIMSIYLLVLSCLPCIDRQECNIKAEQKFSVTSQHQHPQDTDEACTPFCSCSHCPPSAFYQPVAHNNIATAVFQSLKYPIYNSSFSTEVSFSIWQPPKIA